ncbi:hypothetical protein C0J52_24680 [Blattella germanica]|nr:hypothetical protein C0J52_24680 [Blattella germanica]
MENIEIPKRVTENRTEGRRSVGRSKQRWIDSVSEDLKRLGVENWWMTARNRESCRKILKEAKARTGL